MSAIVDFLTRTRDTFQAALDDSRFHATLAETADLVTASLRGGGKLLTIGNGGSAADAQHIAGEFVSRLNYDRAPAAAVALTTDTSVITAIGNDYGYEHVFERQVLALGRPGDVLLALSTSGRSPSVLKAMDRAPAASIAFTGATGGAMPERADVCLHAPSDATPLIQQIHITAAHIVCGLVEESLFPRGTAA
ncbi:D-sedoheptulose 7-phosphate isomerase [Methylobacterium radiotolerans]|uniref:D-sedoheptulose 7-phosphate isomerase n=1 Tax=Methylobacterium radiotolerans TaxID=31998 RepID=UPI001F3C1D9A|nr:D-sedoheptulose 7-phosphate isomerase [Methylobacterium radiotolerans]UIY43262.1 D-sedoheptulose 7-phosphate isomerase [Methylobacterium radiotolerans]